MKLLCLFVLFTVYTPISASSSASPFSDIHATLNRSKRQINLDVPFLVYSTQTSLNGAPLDQQGDKLQFQPLFSVDEYILFHFDVSRVDNLVFFGDKELLIRPLDLGLANFLGINKVSPAGVTFADLAVDWKDQNIYLANNGYIWLHKLTNRNYGRRLIKASSDVSQMMVVPDGEWVAYVNQKKGLMRMSKDGKTLQPMDTGEENLFCLTHDPLSKRFFYLTKSEEYEQEHGSKGNHLYVFYSIDYKAEYDSKREGSILLSSKTTILHCVKHGDAMYLVSFTKAAVANEVYSILVTRLRVKGEGFQTLVEQNQPITGLKLSAVYNRSNECTKPGVCTYMCVHDAQKNVQCMCPESVSVCTQPLRQDQSRFNNPAIKVIKPEKNRYGEVDAQRYRPRSSPTSSLVSNLLTILAPIAICLVLYAGYSFLMKDDPEEGGSINNDGQQANGTMMMDNSMSPTPMNMTVPPGGYLSMVDPYGKMVQAPGSAPPAMAQPPPPPPQGSTTLTTIKSVLASALLGDAAVMPQHQQQPSTKPPPKTSSPVDSPGVLLKKLKKRSRSRSRDKKKDGEDDDDDEKQRRRSRRSKRRSRRSSSSSTSSEKERKTSKVKSRSKSKRSKRSEDKPKKIKVTKSAENMTEEEKQAKKEALHRHLAKSKQNQTKLERLLNEKSEIPPKSEAKQNHADLMEATNRSKSL